jgi:glycosyltransferase involved in cell wall biosynthesis
MHWPAESVVMRSGWTTFVNALMLTTGIFLVRIAKGRVVWTAHNLWAHESFSRRYEGLLKGLLARLCDAIIVHSNAGSRLVEDLLHLGPRKKKLRVIPHGNYIGVYPRGGREEEIKRALGIRNGEFIFLFFGRIREHKALDELVDSFTKIDAGNHRLLVVGTPQTPEIGKKTLELLSNKRASAYLQFVENEDVQAFFDIANVVVLPYRTVLTSGTLYLAMSLARAVIVPRIGDLAEILPTTYPLYYDAADPTALEAAMRKAVSLDLPSLGNEVYEIAKKYDWSEIGRRTHEVYSSAV